MYISAATTGDEHFDARTARLEGPETNTGDKLIASGMVDPFDSAKYIVCVLRITVRRPYGIARKHYCRIAARSEQVVRASPTVPLLEFQAGAHVPRFRDATRAPASIPASFDHPAFLFSVSQPPSLQESELFPTRGRIQRTSPCGFPRTRISLRFGKRKVDWRCHARL